MKTTVTVLLLLAGILVVEGCSMTSRLNAYIGGDFSQVIQKWGSPNTKTKGEDGLTRASYLHRGQVNCEEFVFLIDEANIVKGWSKQPVACPGWGVSLDVNMKTSK